MSFEFHKGKTTAFHVLQFCIWLYSVAEAEKLSSFCRFTDSFCFAGLILNMIPSSIVMTDCFLQLLDLIYFVGQPYAM